MRKVKLTVSAVIFATGSVFLGLGWIDASQWMTLSVTILGAFLGAHTISDVTHQITNK